MKLPFSLSFGKKEVKNYFLALLLQDEKIGAVIFEESAGIMHVVSHSEEHFITSLEEASFEELLDITDKSVSIAEESLPHGIQTEKTVFGVKQEWIQEGKIKKDQLIKLKKVCDELQLQPIGFLVFTEAIIHLLQKDEGAPVSAILVETGKKFIDISIIRAGRIIATHKIPFTSPVPATVDIALKHFSDIEIFPSRIILFNSDNNEKLSQSFISHSWSKTLPFLHMPQITILPPSFDTKGVLYGTATQMGFEVSAHDSVTPIKTHSPKEAQDTFIPAQEIASEEKLEEEKLNLQNVIPEEINKVILPRKTPDLREETVSNDTVGPDFFGFVKNGDVVTDTSYSFHLAKHPQFPKDMPSTVIGQAIEEIPEEMKYEETAFNKQSELPVNSMLLFAGVKKGISSFAQNLSLKRIFQKQRHTTIAAQRDVRQAKSFNKKFLIIPIVLVLIICIVIWYITVVGATVKITLSPKIFEQKQPIIIDTTGSSDFNKNIIAASDAQTQEEGTLSQQATGTKPVGTASKGSVTLFSRLTDTTTITKGTNITASNGLVFTLDSTVTVASFSGDTTDSSVTVANVSLTAADIGPDYNLPSGTKFNINGLSKSDISAKNDTAFSGGTKKDITVVSQKDEDTLLATLTKNMESKATSDITKNVGSSKVALPFFIKEEVNKKTYSKNVGDEAKSVELDAIIIYHGASYDKNDVQSIGQNIFKDKIASDKSLTSNGIESNIIDIKQDNNTISGILDVKASLIPKLDTQTIASMIVGKSFSEAQTLIDKYPQINAIVIQLKPNIPFLPKILPKFSKNIQVVITNE